MDENNTLNERRPTQKTSYSMMQFIWRGQNGSVHGAGRTREWRMTANGFEDFLYFYFFYFIDFRGGKKGLEREKNINLSFQ